MSARDKWQVTSDKAVPVIQTFAVALLTVSVMVQASAMGKNPSLKLSNSLAALNNNQPVKAELITEHTSIQPGGTTRVGVHFLIDEGWHIYAQDPGDAGLSTTIKWRTVSSVMMGPLQWPAPKQFIDPGDIHTFGYSDSVLLSSNASLSSNESIESTAIVIHAEVGWLACKDICVPGSTNLTLNLPVSHDPPARSAQSSLFQ